MLLTLLLVLTNLRIKNKYIFVFGIKDPQMKRNELLSILNLLKRIQSYLYCYPADMTALDTN